MSFRIVCLVPLRRRQQEGAKAVSTGLTSLSPGGLYVTWQGPWPWWPAASGRLCRLSSSHPSQTEGPSLLPLAGLVVTTAGRSNKPLCPRAPGWVPAGSTLLEGGQ